MARRGPVLYDERRCPPGRAGAALAFRRGSDRINGSSRNLGIITRTGVMAKVANIRVGTAGWSFRADVVAFRLGWDASGAVFTPARLRRDQFVVPRRTPPTYAKWRESTPPGFRFAVKIPRAITHELKLRDAANHSSHFWLRPTAWPINEGRSSCSCRRRCRLMVLW